MSKELFFFLITNLPTLASVCGAIYLAAQRMDGWGWFLFAAVLLSLEVNTNVKVANS